MEADLYLSNFLHQKAFAKRTYLASGAYGKTKQSAVPHEWAPSDTIP